MNCIDFLILFVLNFVFFLCEGQVYPPSNQSMIVVLPGSTARLNWTFKNDPSQASLAWYFTRRSDGSNREEIAVKFRNNPAIISSSSLPGVTIESSATLVLKNVDERYNGKYQFVVQAVVGGEAQVELYIAAKPNPMIINCSDPTTVKEGDDLTCVCRDEDGNPPANLTWYDEDDNQIGNTTYGENILTLTNVTKQDSGRYTCKAQSYTLEGEKSFELIVRPNFKPNETEVHFTKNPAILRGSVTVNCSSNGLPEPSYTIMHNDSNTVSNKMKYTIPEVKWSDAGTYKCIAKNKLGSDSASKNLTVTEPTPATPPTSASTSAPTSSTGGLSTGVIIGIIIGVLVLIIIIVVVVVYYCKSIEKERSNSCANIDPVPGNGHELEEPGPSDGAYDTVWTSGSKSKAPVENALPPVYAAVDKNNRQGNTLYASLDNKALQSSRASKKEPDRPQQTEYASIDFAKTGNAPKTV